KVSLTKHGAHKVAALLKKYPKDEVLRHLDTEQGIDINLAQAKKTLAANEKGLIPEVWEKAQKLGPEAIDALVLVAIIFSHGDLIQAMKKSADRRPFAGTIKRGKNIDGKAYTNFAHILEELGYSTGHSKSYVKYDLRRMFYIEGLNKLVSELLAVRLKAVGWTNKTSFQDELLKNQVHEVFGATEVEFRGWIATGTLTAPEGNHGEIEDPDFFFNANDDPSAAAFVFRPGHNKKKIGVVSVIPGKAGSKATLLHNEIQDHLYADLVKRYGESHVGTEVSAGQGTSIDLVVKTDSFCWFYEIKTASSVKACVRQALPQLLEYAYWNGVGKSVDRLIIISLLPITQEAAVYISFLKQKFGIPIDYEQYVIPKK
ncbi:MAG: hypothetical protein AB7O69_17300, partial [Burkholderiales bacterium]